MNEKIILIALSVDDAPEQINHFLNKLPEHTKKHLSSDSIIFSHDPNKIISKNTLNVTTYPETIVVNANGEIQDKIIGIVDWLSPEINERLLDQ